MRNKKFSQCKDKLKTIAANVDNVNLYQQTLIPRTLQFSLPMAA
jgi:transcription-repair coupling factor (superfamily II helicase)